MKPISIWAGMILIAVGLLAAPEASAQQQQRVAVDQATTQQKAIFLRNLVTQSVAAQTIESSGDAAAIAKLEQARGLVTEADGDLKGGNYEVANGKLDAAIALVNAEVRRLSQAEVKGDREREAYEKRLHTVETFMKAYERVSDEKDKNAASNRQLAEIRSLMAAAEAQAAKGEHREATETLDRAYRIARGDIREMREGETLTRSLNFETAEQEYDYERNRNESHMVLLEFAKTERKPPESRLQYIDKLRAEAVGLRERAEKEAAAGKHPDAIDSLVKSTDTLLKAIRMTGLYIPG